MKRIILSLAMMAALIGANAQETTLTRQQILSMSVDQLSELPLEELMQAVEILGVTSVDELFALIMNKNVSSASKAEENSFTSPLSTTVITKNEMRTYGVLSIEEAFRLIPGMIISEKTPGNFDIHMRGLNSIPDNSSLMYTENANTLLMIDGRPMHNYGIAAITMDLMPISIEDVERIEVVRGACGALYGANAVTGVINIITEKPKSDSSKAAGSIQMGNNNNIIGDIAIRNSWKDGKIAAGLTFNMQRRGRTTDKIVVSPTSANRYYVIDDALIEQTRSASVTTDQIQEWIENGQIREALGEENMTVDEVERLRSVSSNTIFSTTEPATKISEQFSDLNFSRKNIGLNGYLSIVPSADMRFDITGGYVNSDALVSDVVEDCYSYNSRLASKFYANVVSQIKDLTVNIGYNAGTQNYVKGFAGYKIWEQSFNANAEYTISVGDLKIKPGVFYEWIKADDYIPFYNHEGEANRRALVAGGMSVYEAYSWHYEDPGTEVDNTTSDRLYSFFGGETHLSSIAPSLRLDYKIGDLRLIGAFRSDKTRIPDKWNHSWQFAANYSINDRNFVRLVYGRANRSCCLINTSAKYQWDRTNMLPAKIYFIGNEDADLVSIDNIEIGYRWRPIDKILVDAEAFYSISRDYGFLMSDQSMFAITGQNLMKDLIACATMLRPAGYPSSTMGGYVYQNGVETRSYLKYKNVPFEPHQVGISLNMDYIISSKLIAKLNFNWQQTKIDNYYSYSRARGITKQLGDATQKLYANLLSGSIIDNFLAEIDDICASTGMSAQEAAIAFFQNEEYAERFHEFGEANSIQQNGSDFYFGSTSFEQPTTTNGYKHKATPSIYGMLGLIYKPMTKLEVSAFANFMGKRTYTTGFGTNELSNRLTVNAKIGYKPVNNFEFFVNAHNLFNNKKQEFIVSDKIGGTYTFGASFNF